MTDTWNDRAWSTYDGGDDVFILWEVGEGGYDWWVKALLAKRVNGELHFAVYQDSGCSCSGEYDCAPEFEFRPNLDWAVGGLCADIRDESDYYGRPDERVAQVASLKAFAQKVRKGEVTIP